MLQIDSNLLSHKGVLCIASKTSITSFVETNFDPYLPCLEEGYCFVYQKNIFSKRSRLRYLTYQLLTFIYSIPHALKNICRQLSTFVFKGIFLFIYAAIASYKTGEPYFPGLRSIFV